MKIERGQGRPKLNWRKAEIREGWVRWRAEEKEKKKTKTFRVFPLEVWTTLQHNLGQFHSSFLDFSRVVLLLLFFLAATYSLTLGKSNSAKWLVHASSPSM